MKTPSMWEWISTELDKMGYRKAANLASRIDSAMVKIYGVSVADGWRRYFECGDMERKYERYIGVDAKVRFICWELLRNCAEGREGYSVACVVEGNICGKCKFAKKHGKCNDNGSLYSRFRESLSLS